MLDFHLAEFYGVENRALKQAVRRNLDLFPTDFMVVLSEQEIEMMLSQHVIPTKQFLEEPIILLLPKQELKCCQVY